MSFTIENNSTFTTHSCTDTTFSVKELVWFWLAHMHKETLETWISLIFGNFCAFLLVKIWLIMSITACNKEWTEQSDHELSMSHPMQNNVTCNNSYKNKAVLVLPKVVNCISFFCNGNEFSFDTAKTHKKSITEYK